MQKQIPSVFNTLNKIHIPRNLYDKYVSNFYNDRHAEGLNLHFKAFVEKYIK